MALLVDTGPLYASIDRRDGSHQKVVQFLEQNRETLIVPVTVLPEAFYLLGRELAPRATRALLQSLLAGELQVENLAGQDLVRVDELLAQYQGSGLDFVDASVAAVAERLRIVRILTLDHRHFGMLRPRHAPAFELLP